jgi:hypothetical protein
MQVTLTQRDRLTDLPTELVLEICSYLRGSGDSELDDQLDRVILRASEVCRRWRVNPALREERYKAVKRMMVREFKIEAKYPIPVCLIFRNAGMPISRLPVLEGERRWLREIRKEKMTAPVMRFTLPGGRAGIILNINPRDTSQRVMQIFLTGTPIQELSKILATYDYDSSSGRHTSSWSYEQRGGSTSSETSFGGAFVAVPQPYFRGHDLNSHRPISDLLLDRDPDLVLADPPMPLSKRCSSFFLGIMRRAAPLVLPLAIGVVAASTQGCE